ncbi:hypothetical protein THIOKS11840013 [Thiocapsa sp. KS1]|nr:hypothetical protein THIOKS11840013 [Thiocapsa sp. KS1]
MVRVTERPDRLLRVTARLGPGVGKPIPSQSPDRRAALLRPGPVPTIAREGVAEQPAGTIQVPHSLS